MRFTRALIVLAGLAAGTAGASAQGTGAFRPNPGITNPSELRFVEPKYTEAARAARIEGMVVLEAVVLANGTVGEVRVIQSLDARHGLDQEAIKCVKEWRFHPATRNGTAVPIIVTLEVMFRLDPAAARREAGLQYAVVAKPPQERLQLPADGFASGAYASDTPLLVKPKERRFVEPKYTAEAMRAKIQGTVVIEVVIGVDGTVTKARIAESLDQVHGLDDNALAAVKLWTFEPGAFGGQNVPVYTRLDVLFRLH